MDRPLNVAAINAAALEARPACRERKDEMALGASKPRLPPAPAPVARRLRSSTAARRSTMRSILPPGPRSDARPGAVQPDCGDRPAVERGCCLSNDYLAIDSRLRPNPAAGRAAARAARREGRSARAGCALAAGAADLAGAGRGLPSGCCDASRGFAGQRPAQIVGRLELSRHNPCAPPRPPPCARSG